MIKRLEIAISVGVTLLVVSTALAKDGGPPKLDMEYACHASEVAVSAVISVTTDIYQSCLNDENDARVQLDKSLSLIHI